MPRRELRGRGPDGRASARPDPVVARVRSMVEGRCQVSPGKRCPVLPTAWVDVCTCTASPRTFNDEHLPGHGKGARVAARLVATRTTGLAPYRERSAVPGSSRPVPPPAEPRREPGYRAERRARLHRRRPREWHPPSSRPPGRPGTSLRAVATRTPRTATGRRADARPR